MYSGQRHALSLLAESLLRRPIAWLLDSRPKLSGQPCCRVGQLKLRGQLPRNFAQSYIRHKRSHTKAPSPAPISQPALACACAVSLGCQAWKVLWWVSRSNQDLLLDFSPPPTHAHPVLIPCSSRASPMLLRPMIGSDCDSSYIMLHSGKISFTPHIFPPSCPDCCKHWICCVYGPV